MKKIAIIIIVSLTALAGAHAGQKAIANSIVSYADSAKPKESKPAVHKDTAAKKDTLAAPQQPVFILQGSYQDFVLLKNALVLLKFYSKENTPDAKAVELVEWIDKQLNYQVQLLQQQPPGAPKK